jgi:hypothetical protein
MSANLAKVVQKLVKPLEERIAALEAKVFPPAQPTDEQVGAIYAESFSGLKNAAAMHNAAAYMAGWAEIHKDGEPMTGEQERQLMEMFRRVLAGPNKRKPRTKKPATE